jgi:predicted dehydrogenase
VGPAFAEYGDYVAVCDVDQRRRDAAAGLVEQWHGKRPLVVAKDYRELLDRDDLDAILVFTPDHWHAKVTVEAMRAGKDVYCEKPLTLTIAEGQLIGRVVKETERIVQVGTQQRSDQRFLDAVALVRAGRIGAVRRVECGLGGAPVSPAIPITEPPAGLDWDMWLGPAAEAPYRSLPGA